MLLRSWSQAEGEATASDSVKYIVRKVQNLVLGCIDADRGE